MVCPIASQDEDRDFKPQQQTSLKIPHVIYGRPLSKFYQVITKHLENMSSTTKRNLTQLRYERDSNIIQLRTNFLTSLLLSDTDVP